MVADLRGLCQEHPAYLLDQVRCVDSTTGETFQFQLLDPEAPWYWQRDLLDLWIDSSKSIALKARQIGITWLAAGYALWMLLHVPGSRVLAVSITQDEAVKIVNRVWDMFKSLPPVLRDVQVLKPTHSHSRPSKQIQLKHPDGRISTMIGLASTSTAGHGETAALVILDEFSRQEYAASSWKACLPTTQGGGRILVISTGNGVSTEKGPNERAGGNFFHHLWVNADHYGLTKRFLPWDLHPDRDEAWYEANAAALPHADRGEQYPRNEREAFILTGRPYFDIDALIHYDDICHLPENQPLYRFDFEEHGSKAVKKRSEFGNIKIFREPDPDRTYAIGADVATGRGYDFSVAYVVDLSDMALCAEFHAKIDYDQFAEQLHYLGRYYNTALLAVETGGGYGDAVLIPLRDGRAGRPTYPKLYKHIMSNRADLPIAKPFGFPMNTKTRPLVISQLEHAIRERALPFLPRRLLDEAQTFVHADTTPSPRAQQGCNDDCVMAAAVTLEMYRLRGTHPKMLARRKAARRQQTYESLYPWKPADTSKRDKAFDERYPKEASPA